MDLGEDMRCVHLGKGDMELNQRQLVLAYCGQNAWVFLDSSDGLISVRKGLGGQSGD